MGQEDTALDVMMSNIACLLPRQKKKKTVGDAHLARRLEFGEKPSW